MAQPADTMMAAERTEPREWPDPVDGDMAAALPAKRRRLWRTFFRRPRDLGCFTPRISFQEVAATLPSIEEAGHWGEVILLEDHISVLHRDGTISYGVHNVTMLQGEWNLAQWDEVSWV